MDCRTKAGVLLTAASTQAATLGVHGIEKDF